MKARHEFDSDLAYNEYLRTYFAAMAMQGIIAKEGYPSQELGERSTAAADALITALNTNP